MVRALFSITIAFILGTLIALSYATYVVASQLEQARIRFEQDMKQQRSEMFR
jgi:CHASE1-domain containing sensor protein